MSFLPLAAMKRIQKVKVTKKKDVYFSDGKLVDYIIEALHNRKERERKN